MTAGRPRKPLEERQLAAKGDGRDAGGRKVVVSTELVPVKRTNEGGIDKRTLPKLPANLGKHGRTEWFKIWESGERWLRPHEDYRQVTFICECYDEIDFLQAEILKTGPMVENYAHVMVANPLYAEVDKRRQMIIRLLSELGFSPTARARLGIAEIKYQSGLAELQEMARKNRGGT